MRFLDFCLSVFLRNLYGLGDWRRVRAGYPPGMGAGIFGAVPLGLRKNAKGGEQGTQLAALRQVSAALQRILLQAKRKPAPGIRRPMPGASPALCVGGEDADAALGWRWECLQLSNGFPEATIQVWSFIGDGMAVKGIEGRDDRDAYCTERANW